MTLRSNNMSELNKLCIAQINLEKSISQIMGHLSKYDLNACEFSAEMDYESKSEHNILQERLKNVVIPLKAKAKLVELNKLHEISDFKSFKKEMINIQEGIQNLKVDTSLKYNSLKNEEELLLKDVNICNENVDEWLKPIKIDLNSKSQVKKSNTCKEKHMYKEAKEFMDFVQSSGGHENGWKEEDHLLYLKLRGKYRKVDEIAKNLNSILPDISEKEIENHDKWYQKYISLKNKKKEAIKVWQKEKEANTTLHNTVDTVIIKKPPKPELNLEERMLQWKMAKEEKEQNKKELEIMKEQKRKDFEEMRRKRNEELKKIVQQWKKIKVEDERKEKLRKVMTEEQEKKQRSVEANKMIRQYQSQDDLFIMRRIKKPEEKKSVRSNSCQMAQRDPQRLFRATKQWINRIHENNNTMEDQSQFAKINYIKSIQKLGVPNWRKKL